MNEPKTWLSPTTVSAMLPWPRSLMLDHVCRGIQRAGSCCNMFFIGYAVQFIKGSRVGPIQCLLNEPEINGYWTCRHPSGLAFAVVDWSSSRISRGLLRAVSPVNTLSGLPFLLLSFRMPWTPMRPTGEEN